MQKLITKQKVFEMLHEDPVKQRRLAGLEKDIQHKFDAFMGQIGEDERVKMAEVLGNAIEYFDRIAIPGEIGPDGKVRLIESKNDSKGGRTVS
ncbi:MAG: hypothetical protein WCF59_05845 [Desulfobaccales bacterium]